MITDTTAAQESLDWLIEHAYKKNCKNYSDGSEDVYFSSFESCVLEDTAEPLQDLINKAEAEEPELEADGYANGKLAYDTWICPNCSTRYELDAHIYEYCPHCGQHIDTEFLEEYLCNK